MSRPVTKKETLLVLMIILPGVFILEWCCGVFEFKPSPPSYSSTWRAEVETRHGHMEQNATITPEGYTWLREQRRGFCSQRDLDHLDSPLSGEELTYLQQHGFIELGQQHWVND